jgi:hypothetical protein
MGKQQAEYAWCRHVSQDGNRLLPRDIRLEAIWDPSAAVVSQAPGPNQEFCTNIGPCQSRTSEDTSMRSQCPLTSCSSGSAPHEPLSVAQHNTAVLPTLSTKVISCKSR